MSQWGTARKFEVGGVNFQAIPHVDSAPFSGIDDNGIITFGLIIQSDADVTTAMEAVVTAFVGKPYSQWLNGLTTSGQRA